MLARALGERAGQPPGDGVEKHHRRQLAAREDVRADRDRVRRRGARRCARRSLRSARRGASARGSVASSSTTACVSGRPCGVSAIDTVLGRRRRRRPRAPPRRRRRASTIPAPPPYGSSSTWPRAQRRRVAVVEEAQLELGAEHGREGPLLGQPRERMRDEVKTSMHRGVRLPVVAKPGREQRFAPRRGRPPHAGLDEREQQAGVELEHVVRGAWRTSRDDAERAAPLLLDARGRRARRRSTRPRSGGGSAARGTASSAPRSTRPVEPDHRPARRPASSATTSPARRRRAGARRPRTAPASLAPSTKNAPASPCGRPTRPTCTSSRVSRRSRARRGDPRARRLALTTVRSARAMRP